MTGIVFLSAEETDGREELIVIAGIAIQRGYTVEEFQKTVFPHPTVGEIYHEIMF